MTTQPLIQISDLSVRYGKKTALNNVNLSLHPGHIVGLVGPNGCGKSTLLEHIVGLQNSKAGSVQIFESEVRKMSKIDAKRIGYLAQNGFMLDWLTVRDHLRYMQSRFDSWDTELVEEYAGHFELPLSKRVRNLSPGSIQKLALLCAIGHKPEILLLDEPASAMDPIARGHLHSLLLRLIREREMLIVIASHFLADLEEVVDEVVILRDGNIIAHDEIDTLRERTFRFTLSGDMDISLPSGCIEEASEDERVDGLAIDYDQDALALFAEEHALTLEITHLNFDDMYRAKMMHLEVA